MCIEKQHHGGTAMRPLSAGLNYCKRFIPTLSRGAGANIANILNFSSIKCMLLIDKRGQRR